MSAQDFRIIGLAQRIRGYGKQLDADPSLATGLLKARRAVFHRNPRACDGDIARELLEVLQETRPEGAD